MAETEPKKCGGMQVSTWAKLINMGLGGLMVFYSVITFFTIAADILSSSPILIVSFKIYEILFGCLLVLAFCDFNFVMKHFRFLKTVTGKGIFNLFLSSMFLIGNGGSVWGWMMFGGFLVFGIFFVAVGCACITGYDDTDIKKDEVKDKAKDSIKKSTAKESD
mmetsp:Transcript_6236/g.8325  ORF Transcript_6236/g.8325 Transcript_6236/m.8325 type:complete len:163 (-) Transcript_6236:143-631(-)|eukprot:CAMPEP_0185608358 /NCGR_PEP_ID=MMETSP0436-20130131/7009_1 /TAXON_ID=626734 ORGANISM="Favella taraikaensis, Strain Fe Narragansett Bay" /NCGR_SAMPLE_ID=MMETSP0436 /ASSEMBLY_ACC=CAM_ASM_000390 /LENGTH=162 /DNA_ID=CAMNT_0028240545 /DNA_START=19 /DNA_END=507 /DNA_ORIENTATION=+